MVKPEPFIRLCLETSISILRINPHLNCKKHCHFTLSHRELNLLQVLSHPQASRKCSKEFVPQNVAGDAGHDWDGQSFADTIMCFDSDHTCKDPLSQYSNTIQVSRFRLAAELSESAACSCRDPAWLACRFLHPAWYPIMQSPDSVLLCRPRACPFAKGIAAIRA